MDITPTGYQTKAFYTKIVACKTVEISQLEDVWYKLRSVSPVTREKVETPQWYLVHKVGLVYSAFSREITVKCVIPLSAPSLYKLLQENPAHYHPFLPYNLETN